MNFYNSLASFSLLAFAFSSLANASCNGPLQDFCVAIDEPKNAVFVNGRFCKNPEDVTVDDFVFSGFETPANTNNSVGFGITKRWVDEVGGMNTQGIAMARTDYAKGGVNPPHWHPRSAELFHVYQGKVMAGFVASAENNYTTFATILRAGEGIMIGQGLPHFAMNVGKRPAIVFTSFNHEKPGLIQQGSSLFDANPRIKSKLLATSLKLDQKTVEKLQSKFLEDHINYVTKST